MRGPFPSDRHGYLCLCRRAPVSPARSGFRGTLTANHQTPKTTEANALYSYLAPYLGLRNTNSPQVAMVGICPVVSEKSNLSLPRSKFRRTLAHVQPTFGVYPDSFPTDPEYSGNPFGMPLVGVGLTGPFTKPWPMSRVSKPELFALLAEMEGNVKNIDRYHSKENDDRPLIIPHLNRASVLFLDGHVESKPYHGLK